MISARAAPKSFSSTLKPSSSRKRPRSVLVSPAYTSEESLPPTSFSLLSSSSSLVHSTTSTCAVMLPARRHEHNDAIQEEKQCQTAIKPQVTKDLPSCPNSTTPLNNRINNGAGHIQKNSKKCSSKQLTKKSNHTERLSSAVDVRPFRIRRGCIVAVRYRPTDKQNVVRIVSSSLEDDIYSSDEMEQKKSIIERRQMYSLGKKGVRNSNTISPNNTMELWLAPQPGRDEGYALVGKQIRFTLPNKSSTQGKSKSAIIEGEIVTVQTNNNDTVKYNWVRVHVLVDKDKVAAHKFLKRYRVRDDHTNISDKEKKRRQSEYIIRGSNNVIISITLVRNIVPSKEKEKQDHDSGCLVVNQWLIKKRIPFPDGLDKEVINQTGKVACYVGNSSDTVKRQQKNWRWVAEKHHPYHTNHILSSGSQVDPILLGKVVKTNFSKMTVTLQKLYLPEHTQQGRLSHHAINECFDDTSHKIICLNGKGICGDSASTQSNAKYTLYELPSNDLLVIGSKYKKIQYGEEISSKHMTTRSGYRFDQDVYYPTYLESNNTEVGDNSNRIIADPSDGVAYDSLTTQICYRCRRAEKYDKMKHCTHETCHGASSKFGSQSRKSWCLDCCRFLRERGVFTMYQYSRWCCPCCVGVCDCEMDMPCRAVQRGHNFFEETIKSNLREVFVTISSLEQSRSGTIVRKNNAQSQGLCSTCLTQCAQSVTKCSVCSMITHKECFKWENELYWNEIGKQKVVKKAVGMEELSKSKREKRSKKLKKRQLKKKQCYVCLFNDRNSSQSQSRSLKNTSIQEPTLSLLNHTARLLEKMPPIDFDLPDSLISHVPEIRSDPYTKDSERRPAVDVHAVQKILPPSIKKPNIHSTSLPSNCPTRPKKLRTTNLKRKIIESPNDIKGHKKTSDMRPKTSEVVRIEKETEENTKEWQPTCCRILPYVKQTSRNKNNSAAHAARAVASARISGKKDKTSHEHKRRGINSESTCDGISSRANRAKQRGIRKDIALSGRSSLGVTKQLSGCEQSLRFGKSMIHGWGVFTDTSINSRDLIVEYRGVLIGNAVADKREKEYENAKIGSDYMFRIDKEVMCDATHHGNVARYINASCTPNCETKIITICGTKRIAIYAKCDIMAGEELCYDYKFDPEFDESKRIPCNCGTPLCRGFMNWNKEYVAIPGWKKTDKKLPDRKIPSVKSVRGVKY